MPMFDDPRRELNRLQQQLLEEEEEYEEYTEDDFSGEDWVEDEIAEAKALLGMEEEDQAIYRNFANDYGRTQRRQMYLEPEEEDEEPVVFDDTRGQRILTFLLVMGILAVAGYWAVVLL